MNVERIDDHVGEAENRFLEQYKGRPNAQALLASFTQHTQKLEDALFGISSSLTLANAQGAQLDIVGALVGAARNGLTDEQYLALIKGTIAQNNGDATTESILNIVRSLFQTNSVFFKQPNSVRHAAQTASATVSISVGDPVVPESVYPIIKAQLIKALAGGVVVNYVGRFFAQDGAMACAGKQPWVRGLGSTRDTTAGGKLGSLLINQPTS